MGVYSSHSIRRKSYRPTQMTMGSGKPGPKTLALREDRRLIENSGFIYPSNIAFTSEFFRSFLERAGVSDSDSYETAKRKLQNTEFSKFEKAAIRHALLCMDHISRTRLIVRSDDYALGVGMWKSFPFMVHLDERTNINLIASKVEKLMKLVLASDYLKKAKHFKRRKQLTGNPGVMLMPFYGDRVILHDAVAPLFSMNLRGKINGKIETSFGPGYGGANSPEAKNFFEGVVTAEAIHFFSGFFRNMRALTLDGLKTVEVPQSFLDVFFRTEKMLSQTNQPTLFSSVYHFFENSDPRYVELILDGYEKGEWVVVQSAPFELPKPIDPPEINSSWQVMRTGRVVGSNITNANKIILVEASNPDPEILRAIKTTKGFTLVVSCSEYEMGPDFQQREFSGIVNSEIMAYADAIVLFDPNNPRELTTAKVYASHLSQGIRELGIPIVRVYLDKALQKSLEANQIQERNSVVYADEYNKRGFFAVE